MTVASKFPLGNGKVPAPWVSWGWGVTVARSSVPHMASSAACEVEPSPAALALTPVLWQVVTWVHLQIRSRCARPEQLHTQNDVFQKKRGGCHRGPTSSFVRHAFPPLTVNLTLLSSTDCSEPWHEAPKCRSSPDLQSVLGTKVDRSPGSGGDIGGRQGADTTSQSLLSDGSERSQEGPSF